MTGTRAPAARRDAVRNYHRILDAAREVLGESGADACMEEIAARAGVGVGTVYRRFASKDALIDELLELALEEILSSTERALARADGYGLEELLRALGQSFADHARDSWPAPSSRAVCRFTRVLDRTSDLDEQRRSGVCRRPLRQTAG